MADSNARTRWDALRAALAMRYANAAEAYVAMGGRAGGEISLQQLERSLQDLNGRVLGLRRGTAAKIVDVHGILADVERTFGTGVNFQQFLQQLAWEDKKPDVLRSKEMIASRVLVGAPGSALRMSRENENPTLPSSLGSVERFSKRTASPATRSPGSMEDYRDPRSLLFPDWKGKKWSSSKTPPAHFMQQQRRTTALHAAVSQDKNAKLLKKLNLHTKMDAIEAAEAKLAKLVQIDDLHKAKQPHGPIQPLIHTPKEPDSSPTPTHQHSAPASAKQVRRQSPEPLQGRPRSPQQHMGNGGMSTKAAELSERLASLNSSVFQQKLSLAETEKNILLKERQELQAQIRQMNHMQKQTQVEMQNKMTDQFGKAMKETFEQIKDVMKSMQGADKKDLLSLNEAFEQKVRKELLHLAAEGENPPSTLVDKRTELYGPLSTELHNYFDSVISVRAETEGERVGNGFFFHLYDQVEKMNDKMRQSKDHVDAANPHSTKSPFLLAIINTVQYNPVLSWYTVDSDDFPNAGSVGKLARLDPLNGQDYTDDFLLEMLIAIRLHQIFPAGADPQSGQSILGTIMPILFGGEHPQRFSRSFSLFPREKLHLLSSKPSIETARVAAALLHSVGVSTPEHFLRLSVREVVGKIMDFPGIWMDRYDSKNDAQVEASKMILGLAQAENAALVSKVSENRVPLSRVENFQEMSLEYEDPADFGEELSEDEDELSRQHKQTQREQKKSMLEERKKRALQRRIEDQDESTQVEKKKIACLAQFEQCFRQLGFESQAKNLAAHALKNRSIFLKEGTSLQKQEGGEDEDEALKRKLDKAMRRWARSEAVLKKQSFENWLHYVNNIKDFMAKVGWRSNLKRIYFDLWSGWNMQFQFSKSVCDRMHSKKNSLLLQDVWCAWREQHENEAETKHEEVIDTTDPAHLASLLRKLEVAVVETHQKHSSLLEMTHNEEVMGNLLQKLSPSACDVLRDAGVTKMEHLVHMTMGPDKKGPYDDAKLRSYGLTDSNDLKRIEMFLIDPESFQFGGITAPPGDFDEKREQLLDDMSNLRQKLNLKRERLMDEFPDDVDQGQSSQQIGEPKDPNLGVLNELLGALGMNQTLQQDNLEDREDETAEALDDNDFPGFKEQAERDKLKRKYISKLKNEDSATQSVLQALTRSLGEVKEHSNDEEVTDPETDVAKKLFSEKIASMEKTMDIFVSAMTRARDLLDNDDLSDDQENSAPAPGALKEPYERAEELSLGTQTSVEVEAQKLAEDVERRSKQSDALEKENMHLREQLESLRVMQARPPVLRPEKGAGKRRSQRNWWSSISDPELAQKYGQNSIDDDASSAGDASLIGDDEDSNSGSALEERYLDASLVNKMLPKNDTPTTFGWSLNSVDNSTPLTRSSLFDNLLEDRIQRGRAALKACIDTTKVELEEIQKDVSDARASVADFNVKYEELQKKGAKSYRPNPRQLQEQVLASDFQRREAEERLKSLTMRENVLKSSIAELNAQYDALDLRQELDDMDRKRSDEVAAASEELDGLIDAEELDPTPDIAERIAEARDKVQRIEASWKLKRNLRLKQIEIDIMGEKMAEDEAILKDDVARSKNVRTHNASDARSELSMALQVMEDSVSQTARGRCRPEVLASMPAVQKLRGAVNRHKLALETTQLAERNKLLEQEKDEREKKLIQDKKNKEEEEMKKMRATGDLHHREKRRQELAEALLKKKIEMFSEAGNYLDDAKAAVKVAEEQGDSGFSKMVIPKVNGTRRHAKLFLADAKAIYDELAGTEQSPELNTQRTDVEDLARKLADCESKLAQHNDELREQAQIVDESEKRLVEEAKKALTLIEGLLKKDLRKVSDTFAQEVSEVRKQMSSLLPILDELSAIEDSAKVKGRGLCAVEEKLRHGWARLAPKLDDALYSELAVGDKSLDVVQAALASGKLSTAHKELLKAEEAYKKVTTAKK